jgi:hypothetical protein
MLKKYSVKVKCEFEGSDAVLTFFFLKLSNIGHFRKTMFAKKLLPNGVFDMESFDRCVSVDDMSPEQRLFLHEDAFSVLGETLLNIIQHNYREHKEMELTEEDFSRIKALIRKGSG